MLTSKSIISVKSRPLQNTTNTLTNYNCILPWYNWRGAGLSARARPPAFLHARGVVGRDGSRVGTDAGSPPCAIAPLGRVKPAPSVLARARRDQQRMCWLTRAQTDDRCELHVRAGKKRGMDRCWQSMALTAAKALEKHGREVPYR